MYCVCFLVVASLAGCFTHPLGNEPRCHSKFDYDEKLLSKLIRMDVAMEAIVTKVEQMETSSENAIAEMQRKAEDIETNFNVQNNAAEESLKAAADKSTAAIQLAIADLQQKGQDIENKFDIQKVAAEKSLDAVVEKAEAAVVAIRKQYEKPDVIFNVKDVSGSPTFGGIIKFRNVVKNDGGAYSLASGCFTAPVQGTYWFTAHICTKENKEISPSIYIRGVLVSRVRVIDEPRYSCGSVSAVSVLQKNDQTCLKSGPNQSSNPLLKNQDYGIDNFMGVLIH